MHAKFILDESRQSKLSPSEMQFYNLVSDYQVSVEDVQSKKEEFEKNAKLTRERGWWICILGLILFIGFIASGMWTVVSVINQRNSDLALSFFMLVTGAGILSAFWLSSAKEVVSINEDGIFTFSEIEKDENLCAKAVEYCEKSELANDWRLNVLATRGKLFIGDVAIMERLYLKDKSEKTRAEILKRTNEISEKLHSPAPAQ